MDNELKQFLKDHIDLVESENTKELFLAVLVTCFID